MSLSILTNTSASPAAADLTKTSQLHQESLQRLSSGSRIEKFSDDAGGLAVSLKLSSALKRNSVCQSNVSNAISFLQTQAGGLKMLANVFSRMSEIVTLMQDPTKAVPDIENYVSEMSTLSAEIEKIRKEDFNGINLFNHGGNPPPLTVQMSENGLQTMDISQSNLVTVVIEAIIAHSGTISEIDPLGNSGGLTGEAFRTALDEISTLMAANGAEQSRLSFALDSLMVNHTATEATNGRIYDLDFAAETTRLSRTSVQVEAGAKMLSQANSSSQIALKLMQQ